MLRRLVVDQLRDLLAVAGYAPASLEVFEMYQRILPEDERLQGRTTRGRRLWTQRFCKQWKFVRRRIGLHQVELTLAQKRAKAPCLQVFLFGVFVTPLNLYFVTSKSILGYSEDSTRQDGFVFLQCLQQRLGLSGS